MHIAKTLTVGTIMTALAAGSALAKGHNQGNTDVPGENVGEQTVSASVNEGAEQRNENAPLKELREAPGMAGSAGK